MSNLYEEDFCRWADQQALLLKTGRIDQLDLSNLIEEVEDMGKSIKRGLQSQLVRLMMHIIKWEIQPQKRSHSWVSSINDARTQIDLTQYHHPSLNNQYIQSIWESSFTLAKRYAQKETRLQTNMTNLSWQEVFEEDYFLDDTQSS